jgi:hypothetical protein
MSTPTIVLKATRVTTMYVKETDETKLVVSAFRPDGKSITALQSIGTNPFHMDIEDETGEFTTGAKWLCREVIVADDRKALNLLIVKA